MSSIPPISISIAGPSRQDQRQSAKALTQIIRGQGGWALTELNRRETMFSAAETESLIFVLPLLSGVSR